MAPTLTDQDIFLSRYRYFLFLSLKTLVRRSNAMIEVTANTNTIALMQLLRSHWSLHENTNIKTRYIPLTTCHHPREMYIYFNFKTQK